MVAAENFGVYFGIGNSVLQSVRREKVVDAPAGVFFAGAESVRPPRVGDLFGVDEAKGVCESAVEQLGHLCAFFVGESGVASVGFRVLEVDFLMGNVHIAAYDDGF